LTAPQIKALLFMPNCLITGGAGFIGSHLAERLIARGDNVIVIDNLVTGSLEHLTQLATNRQFQFHQADVADDSAIAPLFEGIDHVYHLAAMADIVPSINDPMTYHRANVDGTISVLEGARAAGVKRFLYVASSSCYGIPDDYPTPETAPLRPMYPYALTKSIGEQYAMHWWQTYALPVISLRLFNVFGPRHRTTGTYGAVIGVFLAQKLAGEPFTVVGDGTQTRDFTFVDDVVDAMLAAIDSNISGEILNVGSGNTYSVNRLTELLQGDVVYVPKRPGEPDCTFADISKIKKELDWSPKVSLEEGVAALLENIDYWRDAPVWTPDSIEVATADWFKFLDDGNS